MGDEKAVQRVAALDRALNPVQLYRELGEASDEGLVACFQEAASVGMRAWMVSALCVARAQERAGYGEKALEGLAKKFDVSRRAIARLGQIGREILVPRITNEAEATCFPLDQQDFYRAACEAAKPDKPAIDLLAYAETEWFADNSYTPRRFREHLGLIAPVTVDPFKEVERAISDLDGWRETKDADAILWHLRETNRETVRRVVDFLDRVDKVDEQEGGAA